MPVIHTGPSGSTQGNVSGQGINKGGTSVSSPSSSQNKSNSLPVSEANGPIADLYRNKYVPTSLKYPSNLDSDTRGHIIQFSIRNTVESTYTKDRNDSQITEVKNTTGSEIVTSKGRLNFQPKRELIDTTISLYIPDNISENYHSTYNDTSVVDAAQEVATALGSIPGIGGIGNAISQTISALETSTAKLAGSAFGVAINPQKQVLFDGIDFRTFDFSFTFSPSSRPESDTVRDIIKTFKYHAAPKIGSGVVGSFFFMPPSSFVIEYIYNGGADDGGSTNQYLNRIAECVLTDVSVNYSQNGIWSAFDGTGAPTQITLSLSFKEIELIDRNKIDEGF